MSFKSSKATASELSSESSRSPYPRAYTVTTDLVVSPASDESQENVFNVAIGHEREAYDAYLALQKPWFKSSYGLFLVTGWRKSVFTAIALASAAHWALSLVGALITGDWSTLNLFSFGAAALFMGFQVRVYDKRFDKFLAHLDADFSLLSLKYRTGK